MPFLNPNPILSRLIPISQAEIDAPTAAQLADYSAMYMLEEAPYTKYHSDGTNLIQFGSGVITYFTAAELAALALAGDLIPYATYLTSDTLLRYWASSASTLIQEGAAGIPVQWGPFTASSVVKGVAGDPGMGLAVYCSASSSGNITIRNSATVGGGTTVSPLVTAVTMSAGQMIVFGPQDMPNGIVLDLNSGTGTFYVIGT